MRLSATVLVLALAACETTAPSGKEFMGQYDLILVDGSQPPILSRIDTLPFVYMKGVHLEILPTGWNWIRTMQHGLETSAPTHLETDFGTWRVSADRLLLAEQGFSNEMNVRFSVDQRLILSSCSGFFGPCTEWIFVRAP
jgi:hypothetical protein